MKRQNKQTDRYTVIRQIGKGSFGQVYQGKDKINKNQVALKFIQKKGKSSKDIQSLKQQNKLLKNIKHPNIINFIDFLQNDKEIIIVTDYAGSDLTKKLQEQKKFPLQKVKFYSKQILDAMLYLNQNRIIHRDLKPQNILIQQDHIKICDFGFAKKLSASTNFLKSIKGTPLYLAPQIVLQRPYTQKVDVWSFGCIIYELYTGYTPFYANSFRQLAPKILHDVVKFPSDTPNQLRSLITNMLDKHDKTRFNWAQVKNHMFFKQSEVLSQVVQNIPRLNLQKRKSQKDKKQLNQEVVYQQSRVLQKLDDKIQLQDFINIQKQIRINSKQLRQDPCFEYKLNSVFRQKCKEYSSIDNEIVQKVLDILTFLARQKKNNECTDDVIKKESLLIEILTLARLQKDYKMLQKQLKTLCYIIKRNFDRIQINSIINQEITEFITIILEKDNLPIECLNNGLFIIGTLANQAILTFNRSQQYLQNIYDHKILTKICSFFKKKQQLGIVLSCIQQFIHPSQPAKIQQDCFERVVLLLTKMRQEVAQALLKTDFLSQISPLQVYKENNGHYLKFYITILLQCLQISSGMRKQYAKYKYWNQLLNHKVTKPFAFVFNYLITQNEGLDNMITKQLFRQLTKSSQDNKLINVYIMHSGFKNIKASKMPQKNRSGFTNTLLQNIYDILTIKKQQKVKSIKQVYGQLGSISKNFDQLIIRMFAQLVESFQQYQNKGLLNQCIKNAQRIFSFVNSNTNRFEPTIKSLEYLMKVYAQQYSPFRNLQQKSAIQSQLFFYRNIQDCLRKQQFTQLDEDQQTNFVTTTAKCLNYLNDHPQKPNHQHISNISILSFRSNFYKRFFSSKLSQADFYAQLKCILRMMSKNHHMQQFKPTLYYYLGHEVILKCTPYFETKNEELLVQICNLFSILSRETNQFNQQLKQSNIVQYFQTWLISKETSQLLKDKVLYLIGNMAKKSDFFFNDFSKYRTAKAISECIQSNPQCSKILKNTIYAVGNISFYNDRFSKQFQSLIPFFSKALKNEESLKNNLISTISNLLRFTDVYLKSLLKTGLISQIVKIFCNSQVNEKDNVLFNLCVSVIKKLLPYKDSLNDEEMIKIYHRLNLIKNDQIDAITNKIRKTLLAKGLIN